MRQPLLADVQLGHDLHAGGNGILQLQRGRHDALQNAINAEAYAEFFFVWFNVDIAGPALHGIGQNQVHQFDNGSFIGCLLQVSQVHLCFFRLQFNIGIPGLGHRLHDLFEIFLLSGAVGLLNPFQDGAFRGHHRLDVEPGHELDVVHGEYIGGINHGDGQRCADPAERQDLITLRGLERNKLYYRRINFEVRKIDGGNAVLPGEEIGDILVGQEAQLYQSRAETAAALFLDLGCLF